MTSLFEPIEDQASISDCLKLIFSNMYSPEKFPASFGSMVDSVEFIFKLLRNPEEQDQMLVLELVLELIKHKWACTAVFANPTALAYILERNPKAFKSVAEAKFQIVEWMVKKSGWSEDPNVIDSVVMSQLQVYYANGVYNASAAEVPEVKTI